MAAGLLSRRTSSLPPDGRSQRVQRRPNTPIEIGEPAVHRDETKRAAIGQRGTGENSTKFNDVGYVHDLASPFGGLLSFAARG